MFFHGYSPIFAIFLFLSIPQLHAKDSLAPDETLKSPQTLVSSNGTFALGFFTPQNSTNQYLGIWYNEVPVMEVVWVANRENPINDSSGWLRISKNGNLQVLNGKNQTLWNSSTPNVSSTPSSKAQILDSGDFVLLESTSSAIIWQSSYHPTDTLLPNLKLTVTSKNRDDAKGVLKAWKSPSDPSVGRFSCGSDSFLLPQLIVFDGDRKHWRSGPWNGNIFIGIQFDFVDTINAGLVVSTDKQRSISVEFSYPNQTLLTTYKITHDGVFTQPLWNAGEKTWEVTWHAPSTQCDVYGTCGAFGSCNTLRNPICSCLEGFVPKNEEEWANGNWSSGCVRRTQLQCQGDGFLKLSTMKVPDFADWALEVNKDECGSHCLKNCSCVAYAYDSGVGCMTWTRSLIDVQEFKTSGVDLYLRLASSELGSKSNKRRVIDVAVSVSVSAVAVVAWKLWNEGEIVRLIDQTILDPTVEQEILRCLHVGLLCVQEFAFDRPVTATVIAMLNGEIEDLPMPKQPGFTLRQKITSHNTSSSDHPNSINYVSITEVSGR
ncbi:hypothetical protein V2J09_019598 [Rumex salicifolius]